jgi:hypothetical protein
LCRWFDSAPGHQETPKPPSGGFFIWRGILMLMVGTKMKAKVRW